MLEKTADKKFCGFLRVTVDCGSREACKKEFLTNHLGGCNKGAFVKKPVEFYKSGWLRHADNGK